MTPSKFKAKLKGINELFEFGQFKAELIIMTKKLIIVDDHTMLRSGIKSWIENHSDYKVAFEASSWSDCIKIEEELKKSDVKDDLIAIVDISFKIEDSISLNSAKHEENCGFEIIRRFSLIGIPCIVFSSHDTGGFVEHAMSPSIGAKGYVSKNASENILLAALNAVSEGKTYVQAELITGLLEVVDITQTFTKKEKLVADALTIYNSNADIAQKLGLSEKTVVNYLSIIYDKAGVANKIKFLEKMGRL